MNWKEISKPRSVRLLASNCKLPISWVCLTFFGLARNNFNKIYKNGYQSWYRTFSLPYSLSLSLSHTHTQNIDLNYGSNGYLWTLSFSWLFCSLVIGMWTEKKYPNLNLLDCLHLTGNCRLPICWVYLIFFGLVTSWSCCFYWNKETRSQSHTSQVFT